MNLEIFLDENMQLLANISYDDIAMLVEAELGADPRAVELRHENGSGGEHAISFQKLVKHVKLQVKAWMRFEYDRRYSFDDGGDEDDGGDDGGDEDDGGGGHPRRWRRVRGACAWHYSYSGASKFNVFRLDAFS